MERQEREKREREEEKRREEIKRQEREKREKEWEKRREEVERQEREKREKEWENRREELERRERKKREREEEKRREEVEKREREKREREEERELRPPHDDLLGLDLWDWSLTDPAAESSMAPDVFQYGSQEQIIEVSWSHELMEIFIQEWILFCDKTPVKEFTSHDGFCQHQLLTSSPSPATNCIILTMVRHLTQFYYSLTGLKKNGDYSKFLHVGDTSSTSELG